MKVLITGCKGQIGQELVLLAQEYGCEAVGLDRETFDITNQSNVEKIIHHYQPSAVINAAAYTAVDKAESDVDAAYAVNTTGVAYLAQTCADVDIPLVHISTDYVFDGTKVGGYHENDIPNPVGIYGKSKLAGEEAVRKICEKYYILRTSWVFSGYGNNFVKTMLRLGAEKEALSIVADQYGKPTSAREIARAIFVMLNSSKEAWGTYHFAQPEAVSWHQFAESIFAKAREQGAKIDVSTLHAITTAEYPTAAKRPLNSNLDCTKLEKTFNFKIKSWLDSLSKNLLDY
ncbi:MAG: dTDP-4-dehydrorhamnose reductase [Mariprofundaceae bacterium]|nr:dTDP-4-dehydrorhamnose reductase [Mariprofundaceae bacterium]